MKYLTRAKKANPELPDVTFANKITQPPVRKDVETMDAINAFIRRERQQKAGGGTIAGGNIQGQQIGDRTGFAKPIFLPSKNEYVIKGRDSNVVKRFKVSDYKNKQEAKKETFKFYKDFTEKNRERAKTKSIENRAKFNKAKTDYKISINKWVQNWMDNNIDNYELRQSDKFIKNLKEDFKKDFDIASPAKNLKSTIVNNYPNIGTAAKTGKAAFKPYGIFPILRTGGESNIVKKADAPYESLFKRAFFTKKINDNPVLKNRISKYLDYYTLKKPGGSMALDRIKAQYADTLNNLNDVMYVLSDDTGVTKGAKNNLFKNIFPQYEEFRKKQNASKISRDANIAKIEKTLGPKKLKQILNEGTSIDKFLVDEGKALKKIFDVEGLDKSLRYSIDHNLGISNIAKMSKPDMEMALQSLIGTTVKRNNDLGWGGYTIRSQKLIRNINEGKNVAKNLDELNKITQDAYGPELKGKNAYTIVNDKLRFTEDFTFRSNPEERFKSYFREIYQTPQGKKEIIKQAGSLKNLLAKIGCPGKGKAYGGRIQFQEGLSPDVCMTRGAQVIQEKKIDSPAQKANFNKMMKIASVGKNMALLKDVLGPYGLGGDVLLEGMIAVNKTLTGGTPFKESWQDSWLSSIVGGAYDEAGQKLGRQKLFELRSGLSEGAEEFGDYNRKVEEYYKLIDQKNNLDLFKESGDLADTSQEFKFVDNKIKTAERELGRMETRINAQGGFEAAENEFNRKTAERQDADAATSPQSIGRRFVEDNQLNEMLRNDFSGLSSDALPMQKKPRPVLSTYETFKPELPTLPQYKSMYEEAGITPPDNRVLEQDLNQERFRQLFTQPGFMGASDTFFGDTVKMAGGGIAKLAGVSSGVAPVSGPNPQGLLSLKNRVRNY
jgi:hypothetical protein